jgi:hypothetical protein
MVRTAPAHWRVWVTLGPGVGCPWHEGGIFCPAETLEVLVRFRCGLRGCSTVGGERSGADRFSGWSIGFRRRAKACVCIVKDFVRDSSPTSPFDFRGQGVRNGAE